jgi:very-short-patch-repair endonuclease
MFDPPAAIVLAETQHGSISIPQLYTLGATEAVIRHLTGSGQWFRITPMVLRRAGSPHSRGQRAIEAVLDAGADAGLSHTSSAAWWRLNGFRLDPLEVMRLRNSTSPPARLARIVHEPRLFPDHHRTVLDGVPVTVPSRIPFDIAATRPWLAAKALDRAWARDLLSWRSTNVMLGELAERGRKGITLMRELLAERGPDYRPNDTNLEDRFQELAREAGLWDLERQRNLCDREWLGRVDFVSLRRRLVIEVDSALYHEALIDEVADEARRAALTAAGFRVESFTDTEVWFNPKGTVARLRNIASGS